MDKGASTYAGVVIVALILFKFYLIGVAPEQVQVQVIDAGDWRTAFALDLLHRLNNDQPTVETVAFIIAWTIAEDGSDGAFLRNNPLNTTYISPAVNSIINSDGVKGYNTYEDGLDATVMTITNGDYPHILHGLQTNNIDEALNDSEFGTWGTGLGNMLSVIGR